MQPMVLSQKDAESEFIYLSKLIGGYTEKLKGHDRLVINFSKLGTIIDYLSSHKLFSVKAESFVKWLDIYYFLNNTSVINILEYKELKRKASLINNIRKIKTTSSV